MKTQTAKYQFDYQLRTEINGVECFLTGSRYFGRDTINSDIDFYCQYSRESFKRLMDAGFKENKNQGYYRDTNTKIVMGIPGTHIQMQENIQFKHLAQRVIKKHFPIGEVSNKEARDAVWNCIYDAIRGTPGLHLRDYTPGMSQQPEEIQAQSSNEDSISSKERMESLS